MFCHFFSRTFKHHPHPVGPRKHPNHRPRKHHRPSAKRRKSSGHTLKLNMKWKLNSRRGKGYISEVIYQMTFFFAFIIRRNFCVINKNKLLQRNDLCNTFCGHVPYYYTETTFTILSPLIMKVTLHLYSILFFYWWFNDK